MPIILARDAADRPARDGQHEDRRIHTGAHTVALRETPSSFNLSDSGVHPYSLNELLSAEQRAKLMEVELGYGWTNGAVELREDIAKLYRKPDLGRGDRHQTVRPKPIS